MWKVLVQVVAGAAMPFILLGATLAYVPPQYVIGSAAPPECKACSCPGDLDGNGAVSVGELIAAVNSLLHGCPAPAPTFTPITKRTAVVFCPGDCNGDGVVTIAEKDQAIAIINGAPLSTCMAADANGDGRVRSNDITMIIQAINDGCPQ